MAKKQTNQKSKKVNKPVRHTKAELEQLEAQQQMLDEQALENKFRILSVAIFAFSVLFFFIMLFIAWFLTTHFVAPIYKVLANIREDRPIDEYHSGITELDDLAEYIQNKAKENEQRELPPNIVVLFQEFSEKVAKLTPMERTVLQFYIDGYTIEEVAARAFISVNTVKKHNTNINRKLEVSNREELMLYIDLFRRAGRIEEITYHSEL